MIFAACICIVVPFIGVIATPLLGRVHSGIRDFGAVFCSFVSAIAALTLLPKLAHPDLLPVESTLPWLETPIQIGVGVLIDPLSIVLSNVVAVVSFIIMIYCVGYMKDDPARSRFWMWMNGFIGSMLLLIFSNNLFFLFVGWKLVGVCSYGLIGYYYQDQRRYWIGGPAPNKFVTPSQAGLKALVVTGVGDMLMLGGIFILYYYAGTLNFLELYKTAPEWLVAMAADPGMVILTSLLLLAGPAGKSAQLPFHEWLPEAMAGPGPVSALIHAATMVKSGVYLVARLVPLFYYGYWVLGIEQAGWFFHITAWVGVATALLAATQGMVALELKKILAYSTVSQIGYMMLGLGVAGLSPTLLLSGYTAGIFHLVSHALFKACLFLCAGTVIHAVHSIYIHDMGALRKHLPLTWLFTLIAALSLMGFPPFPGFWSKDAILLVALEASVPLFLVGLVTVGFTAFYTIRFLGIVFYGAECKILRDTDSDNGHLNDGTRSMRFAAGVLAGLILISGVGGTYIEGFLHRGFEASLATELSANPVVTSAVIENSPSHALVSILALLFAVAGSLSAYIIYIARKQSPQHFLNAYKPIRSLYSFFWNRWYFDQFYSWVFLDGIAQLSNFVAKEIEGRWDRIINRRLPLVVTESSQYLIRRLRTDTEELIYDVSYVLVLFVLFLSLLLFGLGGV
jgi:NADH-quinone oxidoreductase subunit L